MNKYNEPALCSCGGVLVRVPFIMHEIVQGVKTGRWKHAVSHLECVNCNKQYTVDDSMDGQWHDP